MKKLILAASLAMTTTLAHAAPYDYEYLTVAEAEKADTADNAATLGAIFQALFAQDWDAIGELYADNYVQHNPDMNDGKEGVIELFSSLNYETLVYEPVLQIAEGPYVVAFSKLQFAPDQPMLGVVDINFIRDGKSREHWDIIQPVEDAEKAFAVSAPMADVDSATQNANKERVAEFINVVFNQGEVDRVEDYIAEDYIQHGMGEDGIEAVKADAKERFAGAEVDIKRIISSGDLVLAHTRVTAGEKDFARVDIWRVNGEKLTEHWGVMQEVPEEFAHNNGMF